MQEAIDLYNQFVAEENAAALEQYARLEQAMYAENVRFARESMKTLLRPHFLSEKRERRLRQATESLVAIARKAERRLFKGDVDRLCNYIGLSEIERHLVKAGSRL